MIKKSESKTSLCFKVADKTFEIVLTEDKPNDVKTVFNKLLLELKKGEFNFDLEDSKDDLFYQISKEYIAQLNVELSSIYKELEDYDLLEKSSNEE